MINILFKNLYYFFFDIMVSIRSLNKDKNFIVIFPRIVSQYLKKVLIYDKINKNFFFQSARNKYDILTIFEIFAQESYQLNKLLHWETINKKFLHINSTDKKPLLVDCGSNIGSSCEYFSRLFKNIFSILIEPNKNSADFSSKNISNKNYDIINSPISFEKKIVKFDDSSRDNRASRIDLHNGKKIETKTIDEILSSYSEFIPFIIKIDIEGYEEDLFYKNYEWINKFDIIIIEIHDWMIPYKSISFNFFAAISETMKKNFKRDIIISGENLILIKNNNEIY